MTLHPYGLIVYENGFYVIGYTEEVKDMRTYKLQRMQSVELTKKTFEKPEDFSLEKCKPKIYKKHFLGLSDNVTYFAEQIDSKNVDKYHYRLIFKPSINKIFTCF